MEKEKKLQKIFEKDCILIPKQAKEANKLKYVVIKSVMELI